MTGPAPRNSRHALTDPAPPRARRWLQLLEWCPPTAERGVVLASFVMVRYCSGVWGWKTPSGVRGGAPRCWGWVWPQDSEGGAAASARGFATSRARAAGAGAEWNAPECPTKKNIGFHLVPDGASEAPLRHHGPLPVLTSPSCLGVLSIIAAYNNHLHFRSLLRRFSGISSKVNCA